MTDGTAPHINRQESPPVMQDRTGYYDKNKNQQTDTALRIYIHCSRRIHAELGDTSTLRSGATH